MFPGTLQYSLFGFTGIHYFVNFLSSATRSKLHYLCRNFLKSQRKMLNIFSSSPSLGSKTKNCCCSVTKSCPTLLDPMDCSTPGFPVLQYLLEFAQTHISRVSDDYLTISPSVSPISSCPQSFPASRSFPMSQLFISSGQSTEGSASTSVLAMNIQD